LIDTGKEEETLSPKNEGLGDEIDIFLESQDGWVNRKRDPKMFVPLFSLQNGIKFCSCNHGENGKCSSCMPVAVSN
jgi:hypothetical protein